MEQIYLVTVGGDIRKHVNDDDIVYMAKKYNYKWMEESIEVTENGRPESAFVICFGTDVDRELFAKFLFER